ncbi:Crp/Fnr family transcriptional regulator [Trichlorobacter lovleyi]|uniref:Transcriptional regulator, Crp/Fnr family n=1 Tax=Trichlorobacter lovleyi (strain ATCC BAA-1151 / DSM 17278 / SZ) TaxID=398767 RepID=B3E7J9_TRIL1|nr:Crp/Fnr family transcriptional regulator [Trichlorobacter lovleyi]ACD96516.1 transcriptional regulator, Crp/Fnr family [Trichlorobacter lovleyi SZ]
MELIPLLKNSLLFSGLNDADLASLAAITVRRSFAKGETLFSEGDEATGFYLLVEGHLKLCRVSPDGREKVLHFVRPGETFAEAAFFGDGRYPAESRALEAGEALFLPRQGFMNLMEKNPQFALNLVVSLSLSLRRFARQIEELTFADVASRLASFLVKRAAEKSTSYNGITYLELGIKKGELAAQLGTANETVSRTFRKLKEEGVIELEGRKVTILQMDRLQQLANRQQ